MEHRLYRIRLRSAVVSPIARTAIAAGSGMPKERPSAIMLEKDPAMAGRAIIAITSALVKTRGIPTLLQNGSPHRTQSYYLVVRKGPFCDTLGQNLVKILAQITNSEAASHSWKAASVGGVIRLNYFRRRRISAATPRPKAAIVAGSGTTRMLSM
mgnify:CR=1 FL=1